MTTAHYSRANKLMGEVEAELTRSIHMPEEDRQAVVGAVCLGSAVLVEGVPGTGKTEMAKAIATIIGGDFGRVQGTADTMPADITGSHIWNPETREFEFRQGPLFANVFLADELNRISPRAQAALLQGMQEKQVSVNGETPLSLPDPFIVLATQNPTEMQQGTYPLTKANLDRFAIGIEEKKTYDIDDLLAIDTVKLHQPRQIMEKVEEIDNIRDTIRQVAVPHELKQRTGRIIEGLRAIDKIAQNESVIRGYRPYEQTILQAQALAILNRRDLTNEGDIDVAASYVLPHRIQLTYTAEDEGVTPRHLVTEVIQTIK